VAQDGCTACHRTAIETAALRKRGRGAFGGAKYGGRGKDQVGPPIDEMWGATISLVGGATATVDGAYVRQKLQSPQATLHAGYAAVHASYGKLTDADIVDLIAYLRSIAKSPASPLGNDSAPNALPIAVQSGGADAQTADAEVDGHAVVVDTVIDTVIEILDAISFQGDTAIIKPASLRTLDAVAATLQGNPSIQLVEIQGHTDERGDDAYNLDLSDRRAKAVMKYLVDKGVDARRLTAQGYGGTQPLDRRHNEAAWAKNRRVAFLILKRTTD
jgi:outer membrane protein OmpA-like peptidoglycan-associated protein